MAEIDSPGGSLIGAPPEAADFPRELPVLALKNVVVFPSVVLPIHVSREKSILASVSLAC
jgi:ATP-dependent Lon protease